MFLKYYRPRNYVNAAVTTTVMAGLVAGSCMLGLPVWAICLGVGLVGYSSIKHPREAKKFFEDHLVRHPDVHKYSPQLGNIVDDLYQKSGLKAEDHPIYDLRAKEEKSDTKTTMMKEALNQMGLTPTAMAVLGSGKPVIIISNPLLKLLEDDAEKKAVLAHEFAHVAARHRNIALPNMMLARMSATLNKFTRIMAIFQTGLTAFGVALVAGISAGLLYKGCSKKGDLIGKKADRLPLKDVVDQKKAYKRAAYISSYVVTGVMACFSLAYLKIYALTTGLSLVSKVTMGLMSRSNEYQADRGAVKLGAQPLALVTSLRKLEIVHQRSAEKAFGGAVPKAGVLKKTWGNLVATHPTLPRRVARLSRLAKKQGYTQAQIDHAAKADIYIPADNDIPSHVIEAMVRSM